MKANTVKRVRIGSKHQLTLPKKAVVSLRLHKGDYVEVRVLKDKIELVPMALVPRDQAWFWTPEWQAKEKEAEKALAAGKYKQHDRIEGVIADLRS